MNIGNGLAGVLLLFAGGAGIAKESAAPPQNEQAELLDELTVRAQRLHQMREAIVEAEDRFFARYNALNDNDEFDILCREGRRTGSLRVVRVCYPRIVETATGAEGRAYQDAVERNFAAGDGYAGNAEPALSARARESPASMTLTAKSPEYKENMLRLLRRNKDLRDLVREREELQRRYEDARKRQ